MSQSFAPPGESPSEIWFERSLFAGLNLENIAYGIHLCVFFTTMYYIFKTPPEVKKVGVTFTAIVCLLFAMGTLNNGCGIKFTELMWIDDRNFPGGPPAWILANFNNSNNVVEEAAYIVANFVADASLIYRAYVIWNGNLYIIIIPVLAFLASTVLSVFTVFQSVQPNSSFWSTVTVQFAVPYYSLSMSLNIIISLIIAFRLLHMRRMIAPLGNEHTKVYTSVAAMIIESAALFSGTSLIYIICYARNSNVQNLVQPVLDQVICIAPELIILRVAQGRAWTRDTSKRLESAMSGFQVRSTMNFEHPALNEIRSENDKSGASSGTAFALEQFNLDKSRGKTNSSRTLAEDYVDMGDEAAALA
ncbi:hypothetical protein SCHPADRAFT_831580 [Schizopora paradoxa]|uniref:Uncharacterized protein n=1 Tax=Schizopora paradoxa TaxID=27342 RepID=A0A0H2RGX5_9AGAM|nr:hypothetical protein SCHPADRAFT_831580 [Schizopora paradoxa]